MAAAKGSERVAASVLWVRLLALSAQQHLQLALRNHRVRSPAARWSSDGRSVSGIDRLPQSAKRNSEWRAILRTPLTVFAPPTSTSTTFSCRQHHPRSLRPSSIPNPAPVAQVARPNPHGRTSAERSADGPGEGAVMLDLYRRALPTANAARLPAHLLRRLLERMVLMAGPERHERPPPNATVTTLLEMFLHANPSRGKTDQEKEEMRKIYKSGDNVLPKLRRRRRDDSDDEDRRMLEEVRLLSLQEVGVSSSGSDTISPPAEGRRRNRSRDREERRRRARDASASRSAQQEAVRNRDTSPRPRRVIEHQASLRSLLSTSDFDSQEMEEEIMRQIREDGLLDGIDLENIDTSQEEEITERIAAAFRRRQRERERARFRARHHERSRSGSHSATRQVDGDRPPRRPRPRAESASQEAVQQIAPLQPQTQPQSQADSRSRPPVSRPHLFEAVNGGSREGSRTRSSSQDSNRTARRHHNPRGLSIDSTRPTARSATDLTNRPQTTQEGNAVDRQRPSQNDRRVTDPERVVRASDAMLSRQQANHSAENSPRRAVFTSEMFHSPPLNTPAAAAEAHANLRQFPGINSRMAVANTPVLAPMRRHNSSDSGNLNARPSSSGNSGPRPTISSTHCTTTAESAMMATIIFACGAIVRAWAVSTGLAFPLGHGRDMNVKLLQAAILPAMTILTSSQGAVTVSHGKIPAANPVFSATSALRFPMAAIGSATFATKELGASAMTALVGSGQIAPEDGQNGWRRCPHKHRMVVIGFEDRDAGQRRVVTKDLVGGLAMKDNALLKNAPTAAANTTPADTPGTPTAPAPAIAPPPPDPAAAGATSPVDAPHAWRWRDTDGTIRKARMRAGLFRSNSSSSASSIQRDGGNSKSAAPTAITSAANSNNNATSNDAASNANATSNPNGSTANNSNNNNSNSNNDNGGNANANTSNPTTTNNNTTNTTTSATATTAGQIVLKKQFPPDGGLGLRALALWSYWPQDGVHDELTFPKGAEIREAEDINGDWYWGCYCGRKGLFPGNYVRGL
ncbi:ring finger domain protein [Diplodia corticola]|uniref:Ring finger domain protein n=1 Tax=Diplodia corticola TaxID=236234 RepID=A0A1J9S849_9PEZI|nr:ring finger domain protein [Diplodia corticola]OJD36084.1 ring finger domain protein [Diplodia corticola]